MRYFLFFLALLSGGLAHSQEPSYTTIGENELAGISIYDIHQTADGHYWLATNEGMVRFDGYEFQSVSIEGLMPIALFGLVEDKRGRVFAHNLRGQIVIADSFGARVHYTLPDSLLLPDIGLEIDIQDRVVISAKNTLIVAEGKVVEESSATGALMPMKDGAIMFYDDRMRSWFRIFSDSIEPHSWPSLPINDRINALSFNMGEGEYVFLKNSAQLIQVDADDLTQVIRNFSSDLDGNGSMRVYPLKNSVWFAKNTSGAFVLNSSMSGEFQSKSILNDHFISAVFEDRDGNVLLGTFGEGIHLIRNMNARDITGLDMKDRILSMSMSPKGQLFFGSRSGNVKRTSAGELENLRQGGRKTIEAITAVDDEYVVIADARTTIMSLKDGTEKSVDVGAFKDACAYKQGQMLLATSRGVYTYYPKNEKQNLLTGLDLRMYHVSYDSQSGSIYAASSLGLLLSDSNNIVNKLEVDGRPFSVTDIVSSQGFTFVATDSNGVLVYRNNTLVDRWTDKKNLISNQVVDLCVADSLVYTISNQGLQGLTFSGDSRFLLTSSDGLTSHRMRAVEVFGKSIWVLHSSGIQQIEMIETNQEFVPELEILEVRVLDSIWSLPINGELTSLENNIAFRLASPSLKYMDDIRYEYKLEGADKRSQFNDYGDNVVNYKSLSPGSYLFKARAIYRDIPGPWVEEAFTISAPIWKRWWFYAAISFVLIATIIYGYTRRLNDRQRRLTQLHELNASRLSAIRSQMNPHFIFNALNSIQALVLSGDVDNSYSYITKFAQLVRRTLSDSQKDFIEFDQEIELIKLYLALEKLRFKDDLHFILKTPEMTDFLIPPSIVQPFIENALVHGLMHKKGEKRLEVKFDFVENETLQCEIIDNGVGRAQADLIKARKGTKNESFAVSAISKRLSILKHHFDGQFTVEYSDLFLNDIPSGTCVTLIIPVKRKF